MHLTRLKAADAIESVGEVLLEEGVVIVEGMLDHEQLARFNADLDPLLEAESFDASKFPNETIAWFFGDKTRNVTGVAGKSRVFATEILPHPVYLAACDAVIGPNCARYKLNLAHVLDRGPGGLRQVLHRDEGVWPHLPDPHPEVQLASVMALVDFTAENGATVVAPGSHAWDRDREAQESELVAAEMPAGSAVIYLGSTIHAGGGNVSSHRRRGMHVSYCVGWLWTEENQFLAAPPDVVRTLPRQSQELLGYAIHDAIDIGGGYLGMVDLQDPADLIAAGLL